MHLVVAPSHTTSILGGTKSRDSVCTAPDSFDRVRYSVTSSLFGSLTASVKVCQQGRVSSVSLLVRVALELVELDAVQLLKALAAVFAGEVVVGLGSVFLHVPVEGGPLATLVPADLTLQRSLSRVRASVHLQVIFPFERLPAGLTDEISHS